jgi:Icc-related predicted phosphoesterase
MKILAVSDIHGTSRGKEVALKNSEIYQPDLVVITGDITQFGPPEEAKTFLDVLGTKVQTLAIPGNCDPFEVPEAVEASKAKDLHANKLEIYGITFVGFGGSNQTPFNTIFEQSEDLILTELNKLMESDKGNSTVLITHCPPKGYRDEVIGRGNMGCEAIAQIVKKYKPKLVISGHIHEAYGVEDIGDETVIVNPGAGKDGRAAIIELVINEDADGKKQIDDIKIQLLC